MQDTILLKMRVKKGIIERGTSLEKAFEISQFLKLFKRSLQAPRVLDEPLVHYSQSQILSLDQYIQSILDITHKRNIVGQERMEKTRKIELTKNKRAIAKDLKVTAKTKKATNK